MFAPGNPANDRSRNDLRGSQAGNTFPFQPLKGWPSPYVRLSSRRSLLTLDRYSTSPANYAHGQRCSPKNSGNFTHYFLDKRIRFVYIETHYVKLDNCFIFFGDHRRQLICADSQITCRSSNQQFVVTSYRIRRNTLSCIFKAG